MREVQLILDDAINLDFDHVTLKVLLSNIDQYKNMSFGWILVDGHEADIDLFLQHTGIKLA